MNNRNRGHLALGICVLLIAAILRLVFPGQAPPGLYHDEAYHGLDVMDIQRGNRPLYFPANNGREPLFIYLIGLTVGLLGKSPFALRLAAAPVGILTVAATLAMGRALFSRRVGLLSAVVLAVTLWHVHLSRVGFRAVLLPLFTALTVWQTVRGVRTKKRRHWIAAGVLYGLSFYTYSAARFTLVVLPVFVLYLWLTQPNIRSRQPLQHPLWRGVGLACLAVLVMVAPLAIYTVGHPDIVLGRPGQVSVFNPAINGGDPWGTLAAHTLRTLGMFFVRGDRIWRHNVPWRPVFDPVLGVAFILGLVVALRRARRDPAAGFVLIWTAVMALPTMLAEDAPHFLRAVGVLPVVVLLPALGLDWLATIVKSRLGRLAILILPLLFGLGSTTWAYFTNYAFTNTRMSGFWFEHGAETLSGRINEFLGIGWDGDRMLHGDPGDRHVYLDPTLWEEWQPQIEFLVAASDEMTVGLETNQPTTSQTAVFVWPYGDWQRAWLLLPNPSEITIERGPLSQGDRDPEPFTTYQAFFAAPPDPSVPPMARFSDGVELLDVQVTEVVLDLVRVRLRWRATIPLAEDYTIFLHYLQDGELIDQADRRPAGGYYPATVWRPGDVINDDHYIKYFDASLTGHDIFRIGFWQPESGARLQLLDEAGNPAGHWIEVPVNGH
ncbi:MAG: glycosyltransferase family 39 protein [Chloroflexi bacterium]|nr:glycosyltransferase family 39 protein [Chloroflexota bacterium]